MDLCLMNVVPLQNMPQKWSCGNKNTELGKLHVSMMIMVMKIS
jgi:hypothetical protein